MTNYEVTPRRDRRGRAGHCHGELPRELFAERSLMVALVRVAIERTEHRFLTFKTKTELAPQFNVAREAFGEGASEVVHRTPPGNGSATAASVVVSTLV